MSTYRVVRCSFCQNIQVTEKKKGVKCKHCEKLTRNPIEYGYAIEEPYAASEFCKWLKAEFASGKSANDIFEGLGEKRIRIEKRTGTGG